MAERIAIVSGRHSMSFIEKTNDDCMVGIEPPGSYWVETGKMKTCAQLVLRQARGIYKACWATHSETTARSPTRPDVAVLRRHAGRSLRDGQIHQSIG
jgi:hypothetical protein